MPMYDYKCYGCRADQERNVAIENRDNQACEICLSPLSRAISAPGAVYAQTAKNGLAT